MANDLLFRRLPALRRTQLPYLRIELLRRAARLFEQVEQWHEAGRCRSELGEHERAAALYQRVNNHLQAGSALLAAGRYREALATFTTWLGSLTEADPVAQIQALLGQAACHLLGATSPDSTSLSPSLGLAAYRQARAEIKAAAKQPALAARCWAALGHYGHTISRADLVQEGYETALSLLGADTALLSTDTADQEHLQVAHAYLAAARAWSDLSLGRSLEIWLASWSAAQTSSNEVHNGPDERQEIS